MHQGDLHSGESLWLSDGQPPIICERLSGDSSGETIVIGGGITGALVSLALSQAGMDTILLDKGEIGAGSTAASTGLLQYELDVPLVDLIAIRGERDAVHAYRRGLRAIDELEEHRHC